MTPKSTTSTATFETRLAEYVENARMTALRDELAARAGADLDVQWFLHESPLGDLMILAHGARVVRVAFEREGFENVQADVVHRFGARTLRSDRGLEPVREQLDDYFEGKRRAFRLPVDFAMSSGEFRVNVQQHLRQIDYGTTVTYTRLAQLAGRPSAVRAAASACAKNPLPVIVPCHRVVRSDGSTGEYLGGSESKEWLLRHEGALTPA